MLRTTFRSLWSHKRRLVSTVIAIVLGVAFMAGTLVLTSTINTIFDDLFANVNENTDAVIRGEVLFKDQQSGSQRAKLPEDLVAEVEAVPGVAAAVPTLANTTLTLLDEKGEPMGGQGPPTFVGSWSDDPDLNAYQVADGRAPKAEGEAIIDRATADGGPFSIGDTITLIAPQGREELKVVGISRFGDADSAGGVISIGTTLAQAQIYAGEPDRIDTIDVRAESGISPDQMVQRLEQADLQAKTDVVTGREAADETASEIKSGFGFFSTILLIFAAVALFVGMFIISNTFGILIAQRTRELALLRAIGASRGQVLGSVLVEAGIVGLVSAVLGFLGGVGLAALAFWGLKQGGLDLPSTGLSITPSTAIIAVVVGLVVTAAAAVVPAIRATRVPPIAALRDVAIDTSGSSRLRAGLGVAMAALGAVLILPAFGTEPDSDSLPSIGAGLGLILGAVLVLGPVLARPLSRFVGWPLPRIKGVTGRLARENAMRSPRRTASTASALIIGVTLVGFITVFASSAQVSITNSVSGGFRGDYIIQPSNFNGGLTGVPPVVAEEMAKVDGVDQVASIRSTLAQTELARGRTTTGSVAGIDPEAYEQVFKIKMTEGRFAPLAADEVVIDKQLAEDKDVRIGDEIEVVAVGDKSSSFTVVGIGDDLAILSLYGQSIVTSNDGFATVAATPNDFLIGISLDPGTSVESVRPALKAELTDYPTMKLQDQDQFTGSLVDQIKALLNVIYALLAVSIIIALIGIANTLSLSINERTRELGLLRAMGMTRNQLRSAVRWEAVIVALMGTGLGILLGLGLSWVLVKGLASQGIDTFSVPTQGLIVEVVFGAGLGILASLRPAAKAARLNVLEAIATE